jgi:hypothetical protein
MIMDVHGRDLRYFVTVAKVLLLHTCWHGYQHTAPAPGCKGAQHDSPGYHRHRESLIPAGPPGFHSTGSGRPSFFMRQLSRTPLLSTFIRGAGLISANNAEGLSRRFVLISRRADRLWPPFFRNSPDGTGPRRNLTEPARARASGRVSNGTKRASESVVTVRLVPIGVTRVAQ